MLWHYKTNSVTNRSLKTNDLRQEMDYFSSPTVEDGLVTDGGGLVRVGDSDWRLVIGSGSGRGWVKPTHKPLDERKKQPQELAEVVSDGGQQCVDAIAFFAR